MSFISDDAQSRIKALVDYRKRLAEQFNALRISLELLDIQLRAELDGVAKACGKSDISLDVATGEVVVKESAVAECTDGSESLPHSH